MRNIVTKISLVAGMILVFATLASAQTITEYRGNVPFKFEANGKIYQAGEYAVKPATSDSNFSVLSITHRQSGKSNLLGLTRKDGSDDWTNPGKMVFVKSGSVYTLSRIVTPAFTLKMNPRRSISGLAQNSPADSEFVAVMLNYR